MPPSSIPIHIEIHIVSFKVLASRDISLCASVGESITVPTGGGDSMNEGLGEIGNDSSTLYVGGNGVGSAATSDDFYDLGEAVEEGEDVIDVSS